MSVTRERMLEYLYDELPAQERAAFEQQLAASEAAQRELAGLQATLHETRALFAKDPPPPTRVRTAVLAAAEAQLRAAASQPMGAGGANELPQMAAASRPAGADLAERRAWRWLRATWIVPSIAVAAATLLMLKQRGELFSERDEGVVPQSATPEVSAAQPTAAELATPNAPAPAAEIATAREAPAPAEVDRSAGEGELAARRERASDSVASQSAYVSKGERPARGLGSGSPNGMMVGGPESVAPKAGARDAVAQAKRAKTSPSELDSANAMRARPSAPAAAPAREAESRVAKTAETDDLLSGDLGVARAPVVPAPSAVRADSARRAKDDAFAQPPAGWDSRVPAAAPSIHAQAEAEPEPAKPAPRARSGSVGAMESMPPSAASVERQQLAVAPSPSLGVTELERRAREHAAAGRRTLAATDYRELLRRFPQHAHVSAWKRELTLVSADAGAQPPAAR